MIRTTYATEGKPPIISTANRKAAQYGLAAIARMIAQASLRGSLVYHTAEEEGCDTYHFQHRNGSTSQLSVEVV